jgi:hypothetical protein
MRNILKLVLRKKRAMGSSGERWGVGNSFGVSGGFWVPARGLGFWKCSVAIHARNDAMQFDENY